MDTAFRRRVALFSASIAAALVAALCAAELRGRSSRTFIQPSEVVHATALSDALTLWRQRGVRGRVLVHFARRVAMVSTEGATADEGYVFQAVRDGIIRRIIHVIPDDSWTEVSAKLARFSGAAQTSRGYRLRPSGVSVEVMRRRDLPALSEPVLVTVDLDRWSADAQAWMRSRIGGPEMPVDLLIWSGTGAMTTGGARR